MDTFGKIEPRKNRAMAVYRRLQRDSPSKRKMCEGKKETLANSVVQKCSRIGKIKRFRF